MNTKLSAKNSRRSHRSSSALTVIVICLLVSGLLRLGGNESAIAKEVASLSDPLAQAEDAKAATCETSEHTGPLLQAIRDRQAALEKREKQFVDRLQALTVAEAKLKENTAALLAAEQRLAATLTIADEAAEKDLMRLTAVYENMKVKNAAGLFGEMAPEFAAGFLARMRSDVAAGIMSNLEPGHAYTISLILAGRNARAPSD